MTVKMKDTKYPAVIRNMRNQAISKTVIALTAVVLAVTAALYFFPRMAGGRNAALETYTNDIYGVSFDYPETYDLTETSKRDGEGGPGMVVTLTEKGITIPRNGEGPTAITVGMYENDVATDIREDPVKAWIRGATSSNFTLSRQDEPGTTRVAEKDALLYTWDGLYQGTSVVTEHNGNIIMFSVTYDGDTDLKKREDFTSLVGSVRFYTATSTATGG
jgi:hypothetical protein